jgi:hypothetical protein
MFQPEVDTNDAEKAAVYFRGVSDARLSQHIASSSSLLNSLEGFTTNHLNTAAEAAVVQIARDEQIRRRDAEVGRRARHALAVSIGALIIAACALAVSIANWRLPVK